MVERNSGQCFGDEGRTSSFVCFVFFLLRSNEMLVHREREMTNRCIIIIIIKVEGNIDRARFERNFNKKKKFGKIYSGFKINIAISPLYILIDKNRNEVKQRGKKQFRKEKKRKKETLTSDPMKFVVRSSCPINADRR